MSKGKIKYESLWTSRKLQMVSIFIFLIYLSGDTKLWVEADTRRMWYALTNLQLYLGTENRKYGYLWILILSKWFMTVTNYALTVSIETIEEMPTVLYIQSHQLRAIQVKYIVQKAFRGDEVWMCSGWFNVIISWDFQSQWS